MRRFENPALCFSVVFPVRLLDSLCASVCRMSRRTPLWSVAVWLVVLLTTAQGQENDSCRVHDGQPGLVGAPGRDGRAGLKGEKGEAGKCVIAESQCRKSQT